MIHSLINYCRYIINANGVRCSLSDIESRSPVSKCHCINNLGNQIENWVQLHTERDLCWCPFPDLGSISISRTLHFPHLLTIIGCPVASNRRRWSVQHKCDRPVATDLMKTMCLQKNEPITIICIVTCSLLSSSHMGPKPKAVLVKDGSERGQKSGIFRDCDHLGLWVKEGGWWVW